MSVAAYLRVSSDSQSHATQRATIERAAKRRGDRVTQWFAEKRGGHKLERPVLSELRARARRGELAKLYVFKLDRLTRSGVADTFRVVDELRKSGCELVSVTEGFDLAGPFGDLLIAALAACAQIELQSIRERITAARARVEREGGRWGRPAKFGKPDLPKLLELAASGKTVRQIASIVKVPRSTVQRALQRARALAPSRKRHPRTRPQ